MLFFRPTQDVLQISNTLRYSHLYLEKRDVNMRVLHVLIDLPTIQQENAAVCLKVRGDDDFK